MRTVTTMVLNNGRAATPKTTEAAEEDTRRIIGEIYNNCNSRSNPDLVAGAKMFRTTLRNNKTRNIRTIRGGNKKSRRNKNKLKMLCKSQ